MTRQSETKPEEQMSSAEAADVCVCVSTNDRAVLFSLNSSSDIFQNKMGYIKNRTFYPSGIDWILKINIT